MSLFSRFANLAPDVSDDLSAVESVLEQHPKAEEIAALALLCGRVAFSDMEVDDQERTRITEALVDEYGLEKSIAEAASEAAVHKIIQHSNETHIAARRLSGLDRDKRVQILRVLFRVAVADDISESESVEIQNIGKWLRFTQQEFIAVRSEFREHLSVLKKKND